MSPDVSGGSVAQSLAAALVDDPFYQSITIDCGRDAALRLKCLAHYFARSIHEGHEIGHVSFAASDGAAIWITSDDEVRLEAARVTKYSALNSLLGPKGFANYLEIVGNMERRLPLKIDAAAWYLSIVGVSPTRWGQGIGGRLLSPTLAKADALSAVCFLETFNPRSLPFYARLGFTTVDSLVEPRTGATYQVLLREPKKTVLAA